MDGSAEIFGVFHDIRNAFAGLRGHNLLQWTAPPTGIAMCRDSVLIDEPLMVAVGGELPRSPMSAFSCRLNRSLQHKR